METNTPSNTQYKQVTVDVPEDRLAEFHRFVGRFLAGPTGRRGRGRHLGPQHGHRGRRCAGRHQAAEQGEATGQPTATTEI